MKRWGFFLAGLLALAAAVVLVANPSLVASPDGDEFGSSLSKAAGGAGGVCEKQEGRDWYWCGLELEPGSGWGAMYRLTSDGDCWTAKRAGVRNVADGDPKTDRVEVRGPLLDGCVGIADYVLPDDPPFGDEGPGQLRLAN